MSEVEPELRPLPEADPGLADYAAALREAETPRPDQVLATLRAIEAETRRPVRLWIPLVIAAAAILLSVVFVGPSAIFEEGPAENPTQTPYRSEALTTDGQAQSREAEPEAPPRPTPEPALAPIEEPIPQPIPEPVPVPDPRPKPSTKPAGATKPAPEASPDPGPSSLAQETALLRQIQRAQASGQHGRVLELTRDHARRFPRGTFVGERSLARVRSLCRLGRTADARKASDRFIRKHPKSHLVKQFESACEE
jgi:outer membrane biosynthesis protein TonB